jgi:DNA-binding IclR family transcriptional regulator
MGRQTAVRRKASTETFDSEADAARLVQGLARGLGVLRAFQPGETSLSNSELADRTGLAKPTISRLTRTLTALGYLTFVAQTGRYQLGAGVVALCHSLLAGMPHRIAARPVLQELAEYSRLPASLGMRDRLEMLTIETARHPLGRPARFDLGSRLPMATTSMGRAFLYGLPRGEREILLRRLCLTYGRTAWKSVQVRIDAAFEEIAKRGFCVSLGDRLPDVFAVGAPVIASDGTVLAINCGGLPSEASADYLKNDLGPRLALAASQLSVGADRRA